MSSKKIFRRKWIEKVCSSGYVRLNNNTSIKKCPYNQIRVRNTCKNSPPDTRKSEFYNECRYYSRNVKEKPVIYLYP